MTLHNSGEVRHTTLVDFFFYAVLIMLILLLPIFVRAEGSFYSDRKYLFVRVFLFGIRVITVRFYLSENKLYFSLNGKAGRELTSSDEKKPTKVKIDWLSAIRCTNARITLYAGGDPTPLSLGLAALTMSLNEYLSQMKRSGRVDEFSTNILPCYINNRTTVNFSIRIYSSIALFLSALAHTTNGENNAKRSDR